MIALALATPVARKTSASANGYARSFLACASPDRDLPVKVGPASSASPCRRCESNAICRTAGKACPDQSVSKKGRDDTQCNRHVRPFDNRRLGLAKRPARRHSTTSPAG